MSAPRRIAVLAAALALAACESDIPQTWFPVGPEARDAVPFDALITDPGVYAGREITLVGALTETGGQACLTDRGRQIAVRLTAEQATLLRRASNRATVVRGTFLQNLCPPGYFCPELCAPYGLDAGAEISGLPR